MFDSPALKQVVSGGNPTLPEPSQGQRGIQNPSSTRQGRYFFVADQLFSASSVFSTCLVGLRLMY